MSEFNKHLEQPSDAEIDHAADNLRWEIIVCTLLIGAAVALSSC